MSDPADGLKFNIERSCRYHSRREAFYDSVHKLTMGLSLLAGSSAFAFFFSPANATLGKWFSAAVAVVTTLNLVFSFSHKARDHQVLYRRFKQEAVNLAGADQCNPIAIAEIEKHLLLIEVDEPPVYRALDSSCHNETIRSLTSDPTDIYEKSIPLRWWHGLLMHLWRFSNSPFCPRYSSAKTFSENKPMMGVRWLIGMLLSFAVLGLGYFFFVSP